MPTTRAIILDKDNRILPINIQGELGIYQEENSAKNIAKGYLNQDKLQKKNLITLYKLKYQAVNVNVTKLVIL